MRAVRFDGFGQMPYVTDVPVPEAPDGGVVVRVEATGLCRSDWHGWQGHDADITVPHTPGHELAGVVHSVGAGVEQVRVGQRVTVPFVSGCGRCAVCRAGAAHVCPRQWQPGFSGPGSFAEFVALPSADFNVVPLPDQVSFAVAAGLGCRFATAYRGVVDVGRVRPGESVAVIGCGGVGLAAVMVARALGAEVIATDIDPAALDLARTVGAGAVLVANEDVAEQIRETTGGGADVAIDALGSIGTARAATESLAIRGRHVQIGLLPPRRRGRPGDRPDAHGDRPGAAGPRESRHASSGLSADAGRHRLGQIGSGAAARPHHHAGGGTGCARGAERAHRAGRHDHRARPRIGGAGGP